MRMRYSQETNEEARKKIRGGRRVAEVASGQGTFDAGQTWWSSPSGRIWISLPPNFDRVGNLDRLGSSWLLRRKFAPKLSSSAGAQFIEVRIGTGRLSASIKSGRTLRDSAAQQLPQSRWSNLQQLIWPF